MANEWKNGWTCRLMDGRMDGWTDQWTNRRIGENDFIGCCATNVKYLKKLSSKWVWFGVISNVTAPIQASLQKT